MARVLVMGATGYIGGRLIPRLLEDGHNVRCLVRDKRRLQGKSWHKEVEIFQGDVTDAASLTPAFAHTDIVYYLVHSMGAGKEIFETLDRQAAENVGQVAAEEGIRQIIYLGGLGNIDQEHSAHLRSRNEVGEILRSFKTPVTELRAAVIVGAGSLSFELIHHLVNRLPVMICPRWIYSKTQPIGVDDVISYLAAAVDRPAAVGRIIDIGGPDIVSYGEMMMTVAQVLKLKRKLLPVPVLTPRLSSYWVNLVTPIPSSVAGALIEGLRHDTICTNTRAADIFDIVPISFEESVRRALHALASGEVETMWTGAAGSASQIKVDPSHIKRDRRTLTVEVPSNILFDTVSSIGGKNGWYFADWLWKLRGLIDKQVGGVGLRRGRRDPIKTSVGEALDFWRVEDYVKNKLIRLRAEMKVGGHAWLEFEMEDLGAAKSRLIQTAEYYPRGLFGLLYWYTIYPIHVIVFRGLSRAIVRRALKKFLSAENRNISSEGYIPR